MTVPREIPMLDGLRGVAALIVLISHAANAQMLPEMLGSGFGRVGVALFYALSGFLMAHVCFDRELTTASLRDYAVARGSRVLPLFYIVVIVSIFMLLLMGRNYYSIDNARDAVLNLLLLRGDKVLWSIPVEVQFYVLFVGIWWAHQRGQLALALLALVAMALIMMVIDFAGFWPWRDNLLPFWLHLFVIGIGFRALLGLRYAQLLDFIRCQTGWLVALLALAALMLLPPGLREALGQTPVSVYRDPVVLVTVPLLLCVCCTAHPMFRWLELSVLRWFGLISYSLYLLHWPIIVIAKEIELVARVGGFPAFILVAFAATLISALSQRFIEAPVQAILRHRSRTA